jgi:hypothetical protein
VNNLGLDCFISSRQILVEAVGWSDLLLGVVIGALKPPDPMLMTRRIPVSSFQPPHFAEKKYLTDGARIADELMEVMHPLEETCFRVCSEYVLLGLKKHLVDFGFNVLTVEADPHLRQLVDREYVRWCVEEGVPLNVLKGRRFWNMLEWVAEMPHLREGIVKTGWASWQRKWREEIHKKPLNIP